MSKYAIEQCIINILGANDKHGITFFRLKAAIHKNQKCQKSNLQQIGCVKWEQTSNRLMWQKCFGVVKSIIEYRKNVNVRRKLIDDIIPSLLDKLHSFANWIAQQKRRRMYEIPRKYSNEMSVFHLIPLCECYNKSTKPNEILFLWRLFALVRFCY